MYAGVHCELNTADVTFLQKSRGCFQKYNIGLNFQNIVGGSLEPNQIGNKTIKTNF